MEDLKVVQDAAQLQTVLDKHSLDSRELRVVSSASFPSCTGWSFGLQKQVSTTLPDGLVFQNADALLTTGAWFTEAHIEIAGDDSISLTLFGQKLFIIGKRGRASRHLFRNVRSLSEFLHLIETGPPRGLVNSLFLHRTDPNSLLVQPSLCVHTVCTLVAGGSALVTGFEASRPGDPQRYADVQNYYSIGFAKDYPDAIKRFSKEDQLIIARALGNDAGDHKARMLSEDVQPHAKRAYKSRKKQHNIDRIREAATKKNERRLGKKY